MENNEGWHPIIKSTKSFMIKIKLFVLIMMATVFQAAGQNTRQVESKIERVTVFLNKAQVMRKIKTRIESGKTNLVLSGLTSQLDQQSIQVAGKGSFIIVGISHNQNYIDEFNQPSGLKKLRDSLDIYTQQIMFEQNQKEILNKEEQMLLNNQKVGGTQQNLTVSELKAMADFFRSRLTEIGIAKVKSDEKIKRFNDRISRLTKQINEQSGLLARNTSEIVITLSADAPASAELEVNYVVNSAGWYPVYDLRATNTKNPIQLNYKANVFQNTGEEWSNVKLTLSTANPALGGLKPELYPWYLDFFQPVVRYNMQRDKRAAMRSEAPAAAREEAIEATQDVDAETTANFVSTVQTSVNTEFSIALPYTVTSSAKPTLVDISNYEVKADYQYAVAPKLDADAFLIARATGWEEFSLLPGEASVFFEGTFVGNTYIDPNNIKDTLTISLGRDQRVVVKREKLKDFSSRKTIGTNQRDSYAFEISVRNTKNEPIKIRVEDQLPVSQNSQIEVTPSDTGNAVYNTTTGKLVWELTLQASETKKVQYKFEVRYPKDKQVQGLY